MKLISKLIFVATLISFVVIVTGSLNAEVTTQDADGVLLIPYTLEAPEIDGALDDVWKCVTATRMDSLEAGGTDTTASGEPLIGPDLSINEHFTRSRAMWDEDNLYIFIEVVDDVADTSASDPWNNDCVELFFDGDNSKGSEYDANDAQWRWVYKDVNNAGPAGNVYAWRDTPEGFNLEIALPADVSGDYCPLQEEQEIGFEVSNADNDGEGRERVQHWWTTSGIAWNTPSVFGTAVLLGEDVQQVESVLHIPYTEESPTIDGIMSEDDGWFDDGVAELSDNEVEGGAARDTILTTSVDKQFSFKTMWNEDALYVFVKSYDDIADTSASDPWNNDCVELFFDGDNSKGSEYDANDTQWRWVYKDVNNAGPAGNEYVWSDWDLGWNLEVKLPTGTLGDFCPLLNEQEIGFEISSADNDGEGREIVRHWWTTSGVAWNTPSVFGTAVLVGKGVGIEDEGTVVKDLKLNQNYPNPFNPTTNISFSVKEKGLARINVYNMLGERVETLYHDIASPGRNYKLKFNGSSLPSGIYFYTLETKSNTVTKKMLLLK